jgi:hypothetical protein
MGDLLAKNENYKLQIQATKISQSKGPLIKSFCGGVQGGRFLQKESPLAAGGKSIFSHWH